MGCYCRGDDPDCPQCDGEKYRKKHRRPVWRRELEKKATKEWVDKCISMIYSCFKVALSGKDAFQSLFDSFLILYMEEIKSGNYAGEMDIIEFRAKFGLLFEKRKQTSDDFFKKIENELRATHAADLNNCVIEVQEKMENDFTIRLEKHRKDYDYEMEKKNNELVIMRTEIRNKNAIIAEFEKEHKKRENRNLRFENNDKCLDYDNENNNLGRSYIVNTDKTSIGKEKETRKSKIRKDMEEETEEGEPKDKMIIEVESNFKNENTIVKYSKGEKEETSEREDGDYFELVSKNKAIKTRTEQDELEDFVRICFGENVMIYDSFCIPIDHPNVKPQPDNGLTFQITEANDYWGPDNLVTPTREEINIFDALRLMTNVLVDCESQIKKNIEIHSRSKIRKIIRSHFKQKVNNVKNKANFKIKAILSEIKSSSYGSNYSLSKSFQMGKIINCDNCKNYLISKSESDSELIGKHGAIFQKNHNKYFCSIEGSNNINLLHHYSMYTTYFIESVEC